jgi:hypothetical protein
MEKEIEEVKTKAKAAAAMASVAVAKAPVVPTHAGLPKGDTVMKKASEVLGLKGAGAAPFDFDVPTFEWEFEHPDVPEIDEAYQFSPAQTLAVFVALLTNQRAWLFGDTGCGKTTLVEQVAARMKWPLHRFNFDSQITRIDLVGKTDLIVDPSTEKSITKFVEGTLPKYLAQPYILLFDEIDCTKADGGLRDAAGRGREWPEHHGRWWSDGSWPSDEPHRGRRPTPRVMVMRRAAIREPSRRAERFWIGSPSGSSVTT